MLIASLLPSLGVSPLPSLLLLLLKIKVFTPDPETVEPLPSPAVLAHLETVSPRAAIAFLDFLIYKLGESESQYHDRLAELYIDDVKRERKKGMCWDFS